MRIRNIGLQQFFFKQKVLRIDDRRYEYKQENQTIKYNFFNYYQFNLE